LSERCSPSSADKGRFAATLDASDAGLYRVDLTAKVGKNQVQTAGGAFRRDNNIVEHFASYQHARCWSAWPVKLAAAIGVPISWRVWAGDPYAKSGIVERQMFDL